MKHKKKKLFFWPIRQKLCAVQENGASAHCHRGTQYYCDKKFVMFITVSVHISSTKTIGYFYRIVHSIIVIICMDAARIILTEGNTQYCFVYMSVPTTTEHISKHIVCKFKKYFMQYRRHKYRSLQSNPYILIALILCAKPKCYIYKYTYMHRLKKK